MHVCFMNMCSAGHCMYIQPVYDLSHGRQPVPTHIFKYLTAISPNQQSVFRIPESSPLLKLISPSKVIWMLLMTLSVKFLRHIPALMMYVHTQIALAMAI